MTATWFVRTNSDAVVDVILDDITSSVSIPFSLLYILSPNSLSPFTSTDSSQQA